MVDFFHLAGSYVLARLMMFLALPIAFAIGVVTIMIVALILRPRETLRMIFDETLGKISQRVGRHSRSTR